jgi:hypothetical protein
VASIMPFFRSCNELQLDTAALVMNGIRMRLNKLDRVEYNQVPSIRTFRQFSALFVCLRSLRAFFAGVARKRIA